MGWILFVIIFATNGDVTVSTSGPYADQKACGNAAKAISAALAEPEVSRVKTLCQSSQ